MQMQEKGSLFSLRLRLPCICACTGFTCIMAHTEILAFFEGRPKGNAPICYTIRSSVILFIPGGEHACLCYTTSLIYFHISFLCPDSPLGQHL